MENGVAFTEAFDYFGLDLIEKQWADDIWASEFTMCPEDLPEEFAQKFSPLSYSDIITVMDQLDKGIYCCLREDGNVLNNSVAESSSHNSSRSRVSTMSWTMLQNVDYRKLLAVLYYYVCKGLSNTQDFTEVITGIKATKLYYMLLMIPGSNIYKIFHMTFFEKCLETFFLYKYLEIVSGKRIKKTKPGRSQDDDNEDEYFDMDESMTLQQQRNVAEDLNTLLTTFQELINKFSFKVHPEALVVSLEMLAELTRVERTYGVEEFLKIDDYHSFAPFSRNAYFAMKDFCNPCHGQMSEIIRIVCYHIMPNITLIGGASAPEIANYSNKEQINLRTIAASFIMQNIIPLGEQSHLGVRILIQQICYNMIDKADYRSKATDTVVSIMSRLSVDLYFVLLKWIMKFAMSSGAHHRVIGIELLAKLLLKQVALDRTQLGDSVSHVINEPSHYDLTVPETSKNLSQVPILSFSQPMNGIPIEYKRAMLAIIIDRIRDEAASVRTRAFSLLVEMIKERNKLLEQFFNEIFIKPYVLLPTIDGKSSTEQNFLNWKQFVLSLDKLREPDVSMALMPGGYIIMKKIFEKCLDDKVTVRKAALNLLCRIFLFSSKWMTEENLKRFGKHCRDPALSIRKDMVGIVTDLLHQFPEHEPLCKLWVEEVVPQVADPETRVAEQALNVLHRTILSHMTTFEKTRSPLEVLPWRLVKTLAEQRMRSFLVASCRVWVKNATLTHGHVKIILSHVGKDTDGPAWVMLSAISEYLDFQKPQLVLQHYQDVVSQGLGNHYWDHLVLITLNNCWQQLPLEQQKSVADDMYTKLKAIQVPANLVRYTLEIATSITVTMAEDELFGKKEVAKLTLEMLKLVERHVMKCLRPGNAEQGCNRCVDILALLGGLAAIIPENIDSSTFMLLYKYATCSKVDNSKLQSMAIIALGKMSLRVESFARQLVDGLAHLLTSATDPILLNNVVIAIADIGERFANLIEPLISSMCVCLRSEHKSVRDTTLVLLIELLQEDYLKARGALVFHLLSLIISPDPKPVNIVKYYMKNKGKTVATSLIPALFHYTRCTTHPDYPLLEMSDAERREFDLSSPTCHPERMIIYNFLVSMVVDRLYLIKAISTTVLEGAIHHINLKTSSGEQVVLDALIIMTEISRNIKTESKEDKAEDKTDQAEGENGQENRLVQLAIEMYSNFRQREVLESVIPICCKLKQKLVAEKKKLLPYLRQFVREIVKDFKNEIEYVFMDDKEFGLEILHELNEAKADELLEEEMEDEVVGTDGMVEQASRRELIPVVELSRISVLEQAGVEPITSHSGSRKRMSDEMKDDRQPLKKVQKVAENMDLIEKYDPKLHSQVQVVLEGIPPIVRKPAVSPKLSKMLEVSVVLERIDNPGAASPARSPKRPNSLSPNTGQLSTHIISKNLREKSASPSPGRRNSPRNASSMEREVEKQRNTLSPRSTENTTKEQVPKGRRMQECFSENDAEVFRILEEGAATKSNGRVTRSSSRCSSSQSVNGCDDVEMMSPSRQDTKKNKKKEQETVKKALDCIVMPPPVVSLPCNKKQKSFIPVLKTKGKAPATPSGKNRGSKMLSSTPVTRQASSDTFDSDLSPIVDYEL